METSLQVAETNARLLAELDARLQELGRRLDRLAESMGRWDREDAPAPAPASAAAGTAPAGHVLFVPTPAGYELIHRSGPPPQPGETVALEGQPSRYRVAKVGPSPLPGDRRPCAYLEIT